MDAFSLILGPERGPLKLKVHGCAVDARAYGEKDRGMALAQSQLGGRLDPHRCATMLSASADLVWFSDAAGDVTDANLAATELLGWDLADRSIQSSQAFTLASRAVIEVDAAGQLLATGRWSGDLTLRSADGEAVAVSIVMVAHRDELGRLCWIGTTARDLRRSVELELQLRHQATHDSLTGLVNRDGFESATTLALAQTGAAVLIIDLDHLAGVNTTLGHGAGDTLLTKTAERIRESLRAVDVAGRLDGDEFAVLLPGASAMEALAVAQRILERMATGYTIEAQRLRMRASIGVASGDAADLTVSSLMQNADMALYLAKHGGRNRVEVYDRSAHHRIAERLQLRHDLAVALERDEFHLVYQPIVRLEDGQTSSVESLIRWRHPRHDIIGPDAFIPLLEETGLITEVGRWVLNHALNQLAIWQAANAATALLGVSVNVSAVQMAPQLITHVTDALDASGISPHRLTLELTETALAESTETTLTVLTTLRNLGVRIALDDFGTGYSSLSRLQHLPIDDLKIDRSFVQALATTGDPAMITGICDMATALGMRTIAEGIEQPHQADQLHSLRCDAGQGYLWTRPLAPDETLTHIITRMAHDDIAYGAK